MTAIAKEKTETIVRPTIMDMLGSAVAQGISPEGLEKLVDLQERMSDKESETAFNKAMSKAQAEMTPISADATNPQTRSKYASYAQLDRALRPIYTKHGIALSFDEGDTDKTDHIRILCYVSHKEGYSRTYHKDMPIVTTGLQGKVMMTATHANASADSYGMRYLLKKIFNVAVGEYDDDGNGGAVQLISEGQATNIRNKMKGLKDKKAQDDFIEWVKKTFAIDNLGSLPVGQFKAVQAEVTRRAS